MTFGLRGRHQCPDCARSVYVTTGETGHVLVDIEPDQQGDTAVWRDPEGVLRSRPLSVELPLRPYEERTTLHDATCPAAHRPRLPVWIWERILRPVAALCGICGQPQWADGRWRVCTRCDRAPGTPLPPNYR
ncbi:hypothetical protein DQ384_37980 [Sphaerisporangium album]|uniref:Uncharacterized protein n=1 Tax=Sphaerisporangium album TaxID=509200 RepID=A0A367EMZ9_9ACTN|nr:hypothetical protein [Sphaerisporangium album]RCG19072.1 hypothetical protein DQ384_37980 [Sphaerisporangium album]